MKRAAYYALHYGAEYLAWSIRSIQDVVDDIYIFYTPEPSYGFKSTLKCPETEAQLKTQAFKFAHKPIHWFRGRWHNEGEHRDHALETMRGYGVDTVLVVDADEIWEPAVADSCMRAAEASSVYRWQARFYNFWRSFQWRVIDHFQSFRVVNLHGEGDGTFDLATQPASILHFGYAQSLPVMRYKWTCHGHQRELRDGWIQRFEAWAPDTDMEDLHPCVNNLWDEAHPVEAVVSRTLDVLLYDHPYLNLPLIE